jgi:hypothetical protein
VAIVPAVKLLAVPIEPEYVPVEELINPEYVPVEELINPEYVPVEELINPEYVPPVSVLFSVLEVKV